MKITEQKPRPVKPSWEYRSDATYIIGPRFKHTMNGKVCHGPWMYITFPAIKILERQVGSGRAFYCPKCHVGVHSPDGAGMYRPLSDAWRKQRNFGVQ